MKSKSLVTGVVLFLAVVTGGLARSWDIVVESTAKAGDITLPAGHYRVKLAKTEVEFTAEDSGKTYSTPVKLEESQRKYDDTAVESTRQDGTEVIQEIDLGGTTTKLEFPK